MLENHRTTNMYRLSCWYRRQRIVPQVRTKFYTLSIRMAKSQTVESDRRKVSAVGNNPKIEW